MGADPLIVLPSTPPQEKPAPPRLRDLSPLLVPEELMEDIEKLHEEFRKLDKNTPEGLRDFVVFGVIFNGILRLAAIIEKAKEQSKLVQRVSTLPPGMNEASARLRALKEGR